MQRGKNQKKHIELKNQSVFLASFRFQVFKWRFFLHLNDFRFAGISVKKKLTKKTKKANAKKTMSLKWSVSVTKIKKKLAKATQKWYNYFSLLASITNTHTDTNRKFGETFVCLAIVIFNDSDYVLTYPCTDG